MELVKRHEKVFEIYRFAAICGFPRVLPRGKPVHPLPRLSFEESLLLPRNSNALARLAIFQNGFGALF